MIALAAIFRLHGPEYRARCGDRMPTSHLVAIQDIEHCRTEALGGQVYQCAACQALQYTLLFQTSAAALQALALDAKHLGGQIGMVGVLHTWTRDLAYHPHVY